MSKKVVRAAEAVLSLPGISWLRHQRFEQAFRANRYPGVCRGVYDTYAQASAAAPVTGPLGYDHEAPAAMYRERLDRIYPSDYPMLHWLSKAFASGASRVVDLGGHVGIGYYAYQPYLTYPDQLSWHVVDVPSVARAGRELASERDSARRLGFVDSLAEAPSPDILFTAGCIQYLEDTLAERIAAMPQRPTWVLVNLLPLHDMRTYWTVQSIGHAFCPYRIQQRAAFFDAMSSLGYDCLDRWENPEKSCIIMFDPQHTVNGYVGAAFRLR